MAKTDNKNGKSGPTKMWKWTDKNVKMERQKTDMPEVDRACVKKALHRTKHRRVYELWIIVSLKFPYVHVYTCSCLNIDIWLNSIICLSPFKYSNILVM